MFDGEKCVRCNQHFKFEELTYGADAYGLCADCHAALDPATEPLRMCPHDGQQMDKEVIFHRALIDKCPACGGVWLDADELEIMKAMIAEEARLRPGLFPTYLLLLR
jgi:hypothetical protein